MTAKKVKKQAETPSQPAVENDIISDVDNTLFPLAVLLMSMLANTASNGAAEGECCERTSSASYGLQQAITYARMMDVPFAYSSNGDAFQEHDLLTGLERTLPLNVFPTVEEEILAPMDLIERYQEERSSLNAKIDRVLAEITEKLGGAK